MDGEVAGDGIGHGRQQSTIAIVRCRDIDSCTEGLAGGSYFAGFGFRVWGSGFGVSGFGFRASGFGFRISVSGFGLRISGWELDSDGVARIVF